MKSKHKVNTGGRPFMDKDQRRVQLSTRVEPETMRILNRLRKSIKTGLGRMIDQIVKLHKDDHEI